MTDHVRFAVYYLPPAGPLARFGAGWLGWDAARGAAAEQPDLPGIERITAAPRRYGFHATLKPPFRLAEGRRRAGLAQAVADLAARTPPARCAGLRLGRLGRFLALVPEGDAAELGRVAAACVADLDGFRAPPSAAELERRRKARLSDRQEALLARWGYPHVMEAFRFHMTLTGSLPEADLPAIEAALAGRLPDLPAPFVLDRIALVGERGDGMFEELGRYALTG
jgi:putative phosphonate metabolism protein